MSNQTQAEIAFQDFQSDIIERFKALRSERKFSQQHIADLIGVSKPTVTALEAGRTTWNLRHITAVATAFGIEAHELMYGARDQAADEAVEAVAGAMRMGDPVLSARAFADWMETRPGLHLSPRARKAVAAIDGTPRPEVLTEIAFQMMRELGGYD